MDWGKIVFQLLSQLVQSGILSKEEAKKML